MVIALYIAKQKSEHFLDAKITKKYHAYKGYANTYSVEMLNSFNLELQLNGN